MTPQRPNETKLRSSSRIAVAVVAAGVATLGAACSVSFGSGSGSGSGGDSQACERFTEVATEVEEADMSAPGLKSALRRIHSEAESDGQDEVASAASDLVSAVDDDDASALYKGLGRIEAACGPYGY